MLGANLGLKDGNGNPTLFCIMIMTIGYLFSMCVAVYSLFSAFSTRELNDKTVKYATINSEFLEVLNQTVAKEYEHNKK